MQIYNDAGNISCYKVHYVTKGFAQHYLVNYKKIMTPTTCLELFHVFLHICHHWWRLDVSSTKSKSHMTLMHQKFLKSALYMWL